MTDTIFALATPPGKSGVAVFRLTGPAARSALSELCDAPPPRRAALRRLRWREETLDTALVLFFAAPNSFTGEDVVELQTHGGPAVLAAVARALREIGLRPAEPGEFTRRAFENGRLDLTEVEGLADLIDAETEGQRRQAMHLQDGALATAARDWIDRLTEAYARVEAQVDFSEEGDVIEGGDPLHAVRGALAGLAEEMDRALAGASRGMRVREGLRVVLAGPPNAGKSSLLNALSRRDVAIVTAQPGTTRDALDAPLDLNGVAVTLTDTAGLRDAEDAIEREGVARARTRIEAADLVLWLGDTAPGSEIAEGVLVLHVASKADLGPGPADADIRVSAVTGEGIDALVDRIAAHAADAHAAPTLVTRERQRAHIEAARDACRRASGAPEPELIAEDVRAALDALHRLTGRFDVETMLDALFGSFCIGK